MLILIAESKTMTACSNRIQNSALNKHKPMLDTAANAEMEYLDKFSVAELAPKIGISVALAQSMKKMIFEFPNKSLGEAALYAYTGVVFKALEPASLSPSAILNANKNLRLISSLYGWLRPDDIIKSYRLEFKCKANPESIPTYNYLKPEITSALSVYLEANHCCEILDLMPADAAKCIDWKSLKTGTKVWKVDFVETIDGIEKTPNAGKLKKLRGTLLRQILSENIYNITSLADLESEDYIYDKTDSKNHRIRFITA